MMGVRVEPGPRWPATSPAMTRSSAPPSSEDSRRAVGALEVLVGRVGHLQAPRQVDPQLHAVEGPAAADQLDRGRLDVQDAAARGHPLGRAVGDEATAAVAVLVLEGAVHDVGDGLEAAVRVPRGALGLARGVLHLAHLVHHDERVERARRDAGEGPADREALPLEALRRRRDGEHGTVDVAQTGARDARQGEGVSGDGRHVGLLGSLQLQLPPPQRTRARRCSATPVRGTAAPASGCCRGCWA